MSLLHFYRFPGLSDAASGALLQTMRDHVSEVITGIESEFCFNVEARSALDPSELGTLTWLLRETFEPDRFGEESFLGGEGVVLEVGPRMNFTTAWSTNAVSVCHACGLGKIARIERSRRYQLHTSSPLSDQQISAFLAEVHDRMTECPYPEPLTTFETGIEPEPVVEIRLIE